MIESNWMSLLLLAVGVSLILVEIFAFTFKLLVLGIAALLMSLVCYLLPIPPWALVVLGIIAVVLQVRIARTFPRVAGVPAIEVVGQEGYVSSVTVRDGVTYGLISFSKPFGGSEQWKIKQSTPLTNPCRARVVKVNEDSTLTVEFEGEAAQ
jgi:membrane-bound ClpP family serine protease